MGLVFKKLLATLLARGLLLPYGDVYDIWILLTSTSRLLLSLG